MAAMNNPARGDLPALAEARNYAVDEASMIVNPQPASLEGLPNGQRVVYGHGNLGGPITLVIRAGNVGRIANLPFFDIRNGRVEDATDLFVRGTIAPCYHWVPIAGLDPTEGMANMEVFIRAAAAQLSVGVPAEWSAELRRKIAIIIGTCRATMSAYFTVRVGDLMVGEYVEPLIAFVEGGGNNPARRLEVTAAATPEQKLILESEMDLTLTERNVMGVLVKLAVGIPPVQGYSIVMCGHHYLSDNEAQSRKAFDAMEKEHWTAGEIRTWFETSVDVIRDVLWHKVAHPIQMANKVRWSQSYKVKEMVKKAGNGSGSARLPAQEPAMRAAGSYVSLLSSVSSLLQTYGGNIDFRPLTEAVNWVRYYSPDNEATARPTGMPAEITNRASALGYLQNVLDLGAGAAAFAYGFYKTLSEKEAMQLGRSVNRTLIDSYSLKKLETNSPVSYINGKLNYEDYYAARMATRGQGNYVAPLMSFHPVANPTGI